ncbi:MAG: DUF4430 domain-containing protein [Clostridia bacterium]|nr:DUF4430 domain-containing protein [Clostridia bacterium]
MIRKLQTLAVAVTLFVAVTACNSNNTEEIICVAEPTPEVVAEATPTAEPVLTPAPNPEATSTAEPVIIQEEKEEQNHYCTLFVRCDSVLNNMEKLSKEAVVAENGIIFTSSQVEINEGESVFDLLLRTMKKEKIPFEFSNTPGYNSAYIEGINNLYEFDCGALSGWMYKVNGEFVQKSCSEVYIKAGDVVEWLYTCDMGKDIGKIVE